MHLVRGLVLDPRIPFTGKHSRKKRAPIAQQYNWTRFCLRRAVTLSMLQRQTLARNYCDHWVESAVEFEVQFFEMHLDIRGFQAVIRIRMPYITLSPDC